MHSVHGKCQTPAIFIFGGAAVCNTVQNLHSVSDCMSKEAKDEEEEVGAPMIMQDRPGGTSKLSSRTRHVPSGELSATLAKRSATFNLCYI